MTDYYIQEANLKDALALQRLTEQLMTESSAFSLSQHSNANKINQDSPRITMVLYADDLPIGLGSIDQAELGVAILSDFQGQGLGRFLTENLISWAEQKYIDQIWLEVFATNQVAINLYQSLGFQKISQTNQKMNEQASQLIFKMERKLR